MVCISFQCIIQRLENLHEQEVVTKKNCYKSTELLVLTIKTWYNFLTLK